MHAKAGSSTSAKQREANKGQPSDSSRPIAPQKREKYPPRYGTQHRQDALWEGGNEALPPGWRESRNRDDQPRYWVDALFMATEHRPLPGVRLDESWQLIPGCEWYISPLGRSYFVNHNTRTTSWKKPKPERPAGSLMPECIIKCGGVWCNNSLACLGTSGDILSISGGAICQWTRAGKAVGKPMNIEGGVVGIMFMTVSLDGLKVVGACGDGKVRLWNTKEGSLVGQPWKGNNDRVLCLDWSPNGAEVAGGSQDGTIRRWNTTTGRIITPLIKGSDETVLAIKYSPQGDKFASGGHDGIIRVWSKDGELLIEIKGHDRSVMSLCWSKDGAYIFSGSVDRTIRKWQSIDGKELVVIRGHSNVEVTSLCLSPDESHLVSASIDCSVRIWDLETNQQLGDPLWHDDGVENVVMSSDGQYIASSISGPDAKISVWSLEAALKRPSGDHSADGPRNAEPKGRPVRSKDAILHASQVFKQQSNHRPGGLAKYGKDFWDADTNTEPRSAASPARPSFAHHWRNFLQLSTQPNAPQSIPLEPRRRNFNLLRGSSSIRTVEVAAGRKKKRIYVSPPSAAEVARAEAAAAAAAQHANGNQAGSSAQAGQPQPVSGTQVSQGRPTETVTQASSGGTGDTFYEVSCCGFFFGHRRPSHQS